MEVVVVVCVCVGGTVICRCVSSIPSPFPRPSYSSFDKQGLATWLQPLAHLFSVPLCFFLPLLSVRRKKNLAKSFFFPLYFFFSLTRRWDVPSQSEAPFSEVLSFN